MRTSSRCARSEVGPVALITPLTRRQIEVLQALVDHEGDRAQAAYHLDLVKSTVENHLDAIYQTLNVTNILGAVVWALRHNLVEINQVRGSCTCHERRTGT